MPGQGRLGASRLHHIEQCKVQVAGIGAQGGKALAAGLLPGAAVHRAGGQLAQKRHLPFADQTTGTETYSSGRYLDLHPTPTGIYAIDFNRAYNPYCAYNDTYECPFPPASNRLKTAIRAGEKAPGA